VMKAGQAMFGFHLRMTTVAQAAATCTGC
jgi:hypothetical protein